jgi:hypothetical protein
MKTPTEKPCFFARYSKISKPSNVEPAKPVVLLATENRIATRPLPERLYAYGYPAGITYIEKCILCDMDRSGRPMIRAELLRRLGIDPKTLNPALQSLEHRKLVERSLFNGWFRYALKDPPADCVFARNAGDADALECLRGQDLADELAREPTPVVDEAAKLIRMEAERKAKADRANQAIVLNALRRAEAVSGITELRPFLPADHPQLPDHAARKAINQLLDKGTIVEQRIRLTPRRFAVVYTLADASSGNVQTGDGKRQTQASGCADRA